VTYGAYALSARRDIDAGLLPARLGPAEAAPGLKNPLSLAWRLNRGMLFGWTAGFVIIGALLGTVAATTAQLLADNANAKKYLPALGGPTGATLGMLSMLFLVFSQVITAAGISSVLRLRSEETSLRLEPILATPVDRLRLVGGHIGSPCSPRRSCCSASDCPLGWPTGSPAGTSAPTWARCWVEPCST
jgi:ABC-2 type transport system permease protein